MQLSQAVSRFSNTPLDGLAADGVTWDAAVVYGNFLTFDRFITERSFGQKKRLFQTVDTILTSTPYPVVRTPDNRVYLVTAHNADINGINSFSVYNNIYLLQEAPYQIEIINQMTIEAASGVGGKVVPLVTATVYGDIDRMASSSSFEFDSVSYTTQLVTMPYGTSVGTDNELKIGGVYYDILEVWRNLNTVVAKTNRRSGNV